MSYHSRTHDSDLIRGPSRKAEWTMRRRGRLELRPFRGTEGSGRRIRMKNGCQDGLGALKAKVRWVMNGNIQGAIGKQGRAGVGQMLNRSGSGYCSPSRHCICIHKLIYIAYVLSFQLQSDHATGGVKI